jgi:iron complex outermembrane receptor protein
MLRKSRISLAISAALGVTAAGMLPSVAMAQEEVIEEVIVTGSAIRRKDLDNALPIQVLSAADIAASGVTNVNDLMAKLPSMQGFLTASDSVGGGGGGVRTANLRGIGDQYTLSLLNGRRMAPADSGSTIDLSNIPLAAIERVEVLKDGASALYGSDAIAGVVNFILKESVEGTTVTGRANEPEESGGESWNASIVTGFGNLQDDGYSLVATYSHDDQENLAATDRDFAETGFINFSDGGQDLYFENSSANAIPGNAYAYTGNFDTLVAGFNPDQKANGGQCANQTTPSGEYCRFDYTSTLEILPEYTRDSFFLNGKYKFTENMTGFATILVSNYDMTARIAPYPSGEVPIAKDSALVAQYVRPYLTDAEWAATDTVSGTWRALPAGNRTTEYETDSYNYTAGIDGSYNSITYNVGATYAETKTDQTYDGWLIREPFLEAVASGGVDIFAKSEDFSDDSAAALAPAIYSGDWDEIKSTMWAFDAVASMPVYEIAGREVMMAVGADYRETEYDRSISAANAAESLLFLGADTPYDLKRSQYGMFAEVLVPVLDNLEFSGSVRYDDIDAVEDQNNGGSIDDGDDDVTYKLSALFTATDWMTFRGSVGTGFKAPSMREIGEPLSDFGVTSGTYACPFPAGDPRISTCKPGENQVNVFRQGYGGLQFETSDQYSFGVVLTPWEDFDMTIDYWSIELEDLVERLTESQIMNNFATSDALGLYTTKTNLSTGKEELAIIQAAVNVGNKKNEGVDFAVNKGFDLNWGYLKLGVVGTYMDKSDSSLTGSSLGKFGNDDAVVFEWKTRYMATLSHGNWTHNLSIDYQSDYDDQEQTVEVTGTGVPLGQGPSTDVKLDIDEQYLVDFQTRYMMLEDALGLTFGVNNVGDESPELSLRTSGAGHQVGWDPRYSDAYGRTYYFSADYTF